MDGGAPASSFLSLTDGRTGYAVKVRHDRVALVASLQPSDGGGTMIYLCGGAEVRVSEAPDDIAAGSSQPLRRVTGRIRHPELGGRTPAETLLVNVDAVETIFLMGDNVSLRLRGGHRVDVAGAELPFPV